jgi:hypothetical protein
LRDGLLLELPATLVQPVGCRSTVRPPQLLHHTLLLSLDTLAGRQLVGCVYGRGHQAGKAEEQGGSPFHV